MNHFALTIVGRDRAGIVSQVTKILFDLGCNIADSSCSILGGQFAMILILGHPEAHGSRELWRGVQAPGGFRPVSLPACS